MVKSIMLRLSHCNWHCFKRCAQPCSHKHDSLTAPIVRNHILFPVIIIIIVFFLIYSIFFIFLHDSIKCEYLHGKFAYRHRNRTIRVCIQSQLQHEWILSHLILYDIWLFFHIIITWVAYSHVLNGFKWNAPYPSIY